MSLRFKVAWNTFVQFSGRFLTSIIGFLTTLFLARILGAKDYGVYAKIYTLASFFYLFIDFGLNAIYVRRFKKELTNLWAVFALRTLFFVASIILIALFFLATGNSVFTPQEKLWVLLFSPTILLFGYLTTLNIIFQLEMRYDLSVVASVLGGGAGLIILYFALQYGLIFGILALVFGYFLTFFFAYFFAKKISIFSLVKRSALNKNDMLRFLYEAFPLGTMLFLNTMYSRVDVFVLSAIKGDAAVGIYQLAYKFFEFPLAFAAFFANAVFPHYIVLYENNRPRFWVVFRKATLYLTLASFVFVIGGFILAPLLRFIKTDYAPSSLPLRILVLSFPVFFLTSALSWLLFVQKREKELIFIYGSSFLLNIVLNLIFIPYRGYIAASWITVFGEVLVLLMLIWKIKQIRH